MMSLFQSIATTLLLAFAIRFFVVQPFVVEGSSMEPNFYDSEYILIDKLSYRLRPPARGDVVVFHPPTSPSQNYIKRIIGLPGETVKVIDGQVAVNGQLLEEEYLRTGKVGVGSAVDNVLTTLAQDEFYVMGDNRDHSSDSREWGALKRQNIEGRTWLIVFPFDNFHLVGQPSYEATVSALLDSGVWLLALRSLTRS